MCANEQQAMPPMPTQQQAYQWKRGDAWMVGTVAMDIHGTAITKRGPHSDSPGTRLMKLSHTGELAWVDEDELEFYPPNNTPIETP